MTIEDELRQQMQDATERLTVPPGLSASALQGMRQRRRRRAASAVVTTAVVAVAGVGTLHQYRDSAQVTVKPASSGPTQSSDSAPPPPTSAQLNAAVLAAVFPTSGADFTFDTTHGLGAFSARVHAAAVADCMRAQGGSAPVSAPAVAPHIADFPDLAVIAQQGLSGPSVPDAAADPQLTQCEKSAPMPTWRANAGPLSDEWMRQAEAVNSDPQVLAAWSGFGACATSHGVPAQTEPDFFAYVDGQEQGAATEATRRDIDVRLGGIYASCMQPIESIRTQLRANLRDRFLADHQDDATALQGVIGQWVSAEQRATGVAWTS